MKKIWNIVLACLLLTSVGIARAEVPLSNRLPSELVSQIISESLWEQQFDDSASEASQDLTVFWLQLGRGGAQPVSAVVDQLFGNPIEGESAPAIRLPRLYPVKVLMLRYLRETQPGPRTDKILDAWMGRYLEMALTTIQMANIEELRPIVQGFQSKWASRRLKIRDLSPALRARLGQEVTEQHGTDLQARDSATGKFQVSGLYNEREAIFALDFARSLEDTLITFAHEMIHAADPQLQQHRETYEKSFESVVAILAKWLDGGPEAREVALDIVDHVFFETGLDRFVRFKEMTESIRARRMEGLRSSLRERAEGETPFEPAPEELETIRTWISSAIGLTVENEYRAYGLSVVLYAVLKSKFHILPPSAERQSFLEKFLAGDDVMASYLAVSMNPFLRARSQLFGRYVAPAAREASRDARSRFLFLRITRVLNHLELTYLEETERFLRSLNDRMAGYLRGISLDDLRERSVLPDWARPGGFDLPSNPFNVLTLRITTAWALRFRQNVELFHSDLREINEPLRTLRFGILDLHDLSLGERKLIGVNYGDSPWVNQPETLDPKLKADLDSIPLDLSRYFEIARWRPEAAGAEGSAIEGAVVARNLVRLRTLKATAWLDQSFPTLKSTSLGIRSFLQRLREGLFNADEMPAERAKELEAELVAAWNINGLSANELVRLRQLLADLSAMHRVAEEAQWASIGSLLQQKIRFVLEALDALGVSAEVSSRSLEQAELAERAAFLEELKPYQLKCDGTGERRSFWPFGREPVVHDDYRLGGFWPTKGPFHIGEHKFPLTIVCFRGALHLVRQPGDYLNSMTTLVRDGAPEARIFNGARPVRLFRLERAAGKEAVGR
ncbi:MAG: hypothetical protein NDJ90_04265 [Oligoflexia bacterium]|nr:hypothetical protein [Oligoflexia bacterium]